MNRRICFKVFLFFILCAQIFAAGKQEESVIKTQNDEWILCVTGIDASQLPSQRNISEIVSRMMVERLNAVSYRTRISSEYAFYEDKAWANSRSAAARALNAKLEERASLIYRGDPDWRYRRNIETIDSEIERLRANLNEIEKNAPNINNEPGFKLFPSNLDLVFPAAPLAGAEYKFCGDRRIDAFLVVSISDFYGRYLLSLKLYTVFTRSYSWEDSIVFSYDDINDALDEITQRLHLVLSGNHPASVAIRTEPNDALLLINNSYVNRDGNITIEYPPGSITIGASAPNYESLTINTDVKGGEQIDIYFRLNPVDYRNIDILSGSQGSVYHGALYVGETPLTLRLPAGRMEYIEFETPSMERSAVIFQVPEGSDLSQSLTLFPALPPDRGHVEKERRAYYWAWGGTWITGISTWIAYQSYMSADAAIKTANSPTQNFYDSHRTMYYFSMGTAIAFGAVTVYGIYRLVRYLYTANKNAAITAEVEEN
ncbi:MAG: hypothetical protein FWC06_07310 [Treponema sp.]|nr:hypothetical protein [Treponema sp.]